MKRFFAFTIFCFCCFISKGQSNLSIELSGGGGISNYNLFQTEFDDVSNYKAASISMFTLAYQLPAVSYIKLETSFGYFTSGDNLLRPAGMSYCIQPTFQSISNGTLRRNSTYIFGETAIKFTYLTFPPSSLGVFSLFFRPGYYFGLKINEKNILFDSGNNIVDETNNFHLDY